VNEDLRLLRALRRVLESASDGGSLSASLVTELRDSPGAGRDVAREVLLGHPMDLALRPLLDGSVPETSILASVIAGAAAGSVESAGRSGRGLSDIMEGWAKARDNVRMEEGVWRFRSLVASGVLGAVCAMIATVGPLVGSFSLAPQPGQVGAAGLPYLAAGMCAASSAMLGLFTSGKGLVITLAASMCAFAVVFVLAAPLGSFTPASLSW
jgi:hypothetical protein